MSVQIGSVRPQLSTPPAALPAAEPAGPRTWRRDIISGGQIVETCPSWCISSHERDRRGMLDDLAHVSAETAASMQVLDHWADGTPVALPVAILSACIQVDPYSTNPQRSIPHVTFEPAPDEVVECLDPEGFAAIIAQIRAHADRLEGVLAQLVQARAEYC